MPIYVAFLRGINVGGQKMIKMDLLAQIFEKTGFKKIKTYIQSGNVAFENPKASNEALGQKIEKALQKSFGYEVPTVVRSVSDLETIVKKNPFKKAKLDKQTMLYVSFLDKAPESVLKKEFLATKDTSDEIRMFDEEVYVLCHKGYNDTVFSNSFVEKKLKVRSTTRNWNTVNKMVELGNSLSS